MTSRKALLLNASLAALTAAMPARAAEWLLLSREGGCATLDVLQRKLPDLPPVQTPDQLEAYLKTAGLQYSRKAHPDGGRGFQEFVVPSAGLSVVLAPRTQCREVLPGPQQAR
ncbi:MAG: hypothetical protein ACOY3X_09495 [Pseudomonadota bacterium]